MSKDVFSSADYFSPAAKRAEVKILRGVSRVSMNHVSLTIFVEYDAPQTRGLVSILLRMKQDQPIESIVTGSQLETSEESLILVYPMHQ